MDAAQTNLHKAKPSESTKKTGLYKNFNFLCHLEFKRLVKIYGAISAMQIRKPKNGIYSFTLTWPG